MKQIHILLLLLIISACGFTPVHGTRHINDKLSQIEIMIASGHNRQIVRNHLIDKLYSNGQPSSPLYKLQISPIIEKTVTIGIDDDDEISRTQLRLSTQITLTDKDNKNILHRIVRATTAYNILAGQFTTYITEKNARENALKTLSKNIKTQLELHLSQ